MKLLLVDTQPIKLDQPATVPANQASNPDFSKVLRRGVDLQLQQTADADAVDQSSSLTKQPSPANAENEAKQTESNQPLPTQLFAQSESLVLSQAHSGSRLTADRVDGPLGTPFKLKAESLNDKPTAPIAGQALPADGKPLPGFNPISNSALLLGQSNLAVIGESNARLAPQLSQALLSQVPSEANSIDRLSGLNGGLNSALPSELNNGAKLPVPTALTGSEVVVKGEISESLATSQKFPVAQAAAAAGLVLSANKAEKSNWLPENRLITNLPPTNFPITNLPITNLPIKSVSIETESPVSNPKAGLDQLANKSGQPASDKLFPMLNSAQTESVDSLSSTVNRLLKGVNDNRFQNFVTHAKPGLQNSDALASSEKGFPTDLLLDKTALSNKNLISSQRMAQNELYHHGLSASKQGAPNLPVPTASDASIDKFPSAAGMPAALDPTVTTDLGLPKSALELNTVEIIGHRKADLASVYSTMSVNLTAAAPQANALSTSSPIVQTPFELLSLPKQAGAHDLGNGLGERVNLMLNQKLNSATIRLDPPILGKLDVQIKLTDDLTLVTIQAQQSQTRELIESASHRLRDFLQEAGYNNVNVDVSDRQPQSQGQFEQADSMDENIEVTIDPNLAQLELNQHNSRQHGSNGVIDTFV